jgi:hypothetical protein
MNDIAAFALNLLLTLLITIFAIGYLAPSLFRILVDLCGTEDRARFWLTFSKMLLVGMPAVMALGYRPTLGIADPWYFGLAQELSRGLMTLLVVVVGLGLVITFFAAIAPRARKGDAS